MQWLVYLAASLEDTDLIITKASLSFPSAGLHEQVKFKAADIHP
jgi:hypothetical protein